MPDAVKYMRWSMISLRSSDVTQHAWATETSLRVSRICRHEPDSRKQAGRMLRTGDKQLGCKMSAFTRGSHLSTNH